MLMLSVSRSERYFFHFSVDADALFFRHSVHRVLSVSQKERNFAVFASIQMLDSLVSSSLDTLVFHLSIDSDTSLVFHLSIDTDTSLFFHLSIDTDTSLFFHLSVDTDTSSVFHLSVHTDTLLFHLPTQ